MKIYKMDIQTIINKYLWGNPIGKILNICKRC